MKNNNNSIKNTTQLTKNKQLKTNNAIQVTKIDR